ncbi:MAG: hypothetical protein IJV03_01565 [Alphaproteobacteria bacterium]|nr:hypothetical protein [Alphaproteobacteria bacterium]
MRKNLSLLIVFFIAPTVCVANEYYEMAKKCDEVAEVEQQVATSNIQIVQIVDKQKDCYKNIANKIINTEYAQNKQKMKAEFDKLVNVSSELAYSMQYPDSCNPNCGTIVGLNAATSELEMLKAYIQQLLHIVSPK